MKVRLFILLAVALCASNSAVFNYISTIDLAGTVNELEEPVGLAYANGRLYIADAERDYVYVVNEGGGFVQKIGGPGFSDSALSRPAGISYEGGNLYIADRGNGVVKIYGGSTTLQKIGQGISEMTEPNGVFAYGNGIYISDSGSDRIFVFDRGTRNYITSLGSPGMRDKQFDSPSSVFIKDGLMYVADTGNDRISVYDMNFTPVRTIGRGEGGVELNEPEDVFVGDLVYVADTGNDRVVVFSKDGFPLETFDGYGPGNASFSSPRGVLAVGSTLYVADSGNGRVLAFRIDASTLGQSVAEAIGAANQSLGEFLSLSAIGARINASVESTAPALFAQATSLHSQGMLADAQSIAISADAEAIRAKADLEQQITFRGRSLLEGARAKLARYENRSSDMDIRQKETEARNKIASAQVKLDAHDYDGATLAVLSAVQAAGNLESIYLGRTQQRTEEEQNRTGVDVSGRLAELDSRMAGMKSRAAAVQSDLDLVYAESLFASAKGAIAAGNLADANATLAFISDELDKSEALLSAREGEVFSALAAVNSTESELGSIEKSKILIAPNLQAARLTLAGAREKAYSDPAGARELAKQALDSAKQEGSNARLLSVAVIVLAVFVLAFFAAVAAGIFWYLRKKMK